LFDSLNHLPDETRFQKKGVKTPKASGGWWKKVKERNRIEQLRKTASKKTDGTNTTEDGK